MYDTIRFSLKGTDEELQRAREGIYNSVENVNLSTGASRFTSGFLDNMRVLVNDRQIMCDGSLPKFAVGNNVQSLTLKETVSAFQCISDVLGVDVSNALVSRIDVASTMETKDIPEDYMNILGSCNGFVYSSMDDTLYYKTYLNRKGCLKIYDKRKECYDKRSAVPVGFGNNLLRCELSASNKTAIKNVFGKKHVTVADLCTPSFYNECVNVWADSFLGIETYEDVSIPENATPKQLHDLYLYELQAQCKQKAEELKKKYFGFDFIGNAQVKANNKARFKKIIQPPKGLLSSEHAAEYRKIIESTRTGNLLNS